jgi:mRNA-degrading endonuclease toxin of MazEF toxin-antitoxin module
LATSKGKPKKYEVRKDGTKIFGPYKGSEKNGGRPMMVVRKKDGSSTSTSAARDKYEQKTGKKLPRDMDVHHKDNMGRKGHDSPKNLSIMSHKANVADGNKRRGPKKK